MMEVGAWLVAAPALALVVAAMLLPGLVVALSARLRVLDALGVAPALSLGVLALADVVAWKSGADWGLPVIAGVTVALAIGGAVLAWLVSRLRPERVARGRMPRAHLWWFLGCVLVAGGLGGLALMRGIGSPATLNQTYDAAFHINAVDLVAEHRSAAPSLLSLLQNPEGEPTGFYPPLFHAVAALPVLMLGISPVMACNLVALAIALLWPLATTSLVRTVVGSDRFAFAAATMGAGLIALYPALLLTFGVLWPNTLSYLALPAMVACGARVLRIQRRAWASEATDQPIAWWQALGVALLVVPGLYLAHPGAAFALMFLTLPMLVAAILHHVPQWAARRTHRQGRGQSRAPMVWTAAGLLVLALLVHLVWKRLDSVATLASVRKFNWPARETSAQAIGEVITLGTTFSTPAIGFGVLVVLGAVVAIRRGAWWLVGAHLTIAYLALAAASMDGYWTQRLTGFWYNDNYRIFAILAVTAVPLVALGALSARELVQAVLLRWRGLPRGAVRRGVASAAEALDARTMPLLSAGAVVAAVVALAQTGTLGVGAIAADVRESYLAVETPGDDSVLASTAEQEMFERLKKVVPPGSRIAGNPWTGEVYAGIYSDREVVWPIMRGIDDPDRALLRQRFRDLASDPAVCDAIRRLNVTVVTTDTNVFWRERNSDTPYPGFEDLANVPGLTKIDQAGTASAYRIDGCS